MAVCVAFRKGRIRPSPNAKYKFPTTPLYGKTTVLSTIKGVGFWVLGFGFWVLGFGFWVLTKLGIPSLLPIFTSWLFRLSSCFPHLSSFLLSLLSRPFPTIRPIKYGTNNVIKGFFDSIHKVSV